MTKFNYETYEKLFAELLDSVAATFSETEMKEVHGFIEASEYGLALQTFIDIVVEEKKRIHLRSAAVCEELARLMELTDEVDLQAVRKATL